MPPLAIASREKGCDGMTSKLKQWNDRVHDKCDLCGSFDSHIHVWRLYVSRRWPSFSLAMCDACHFANVNHKEAHDIMYGIGLEILDRLRRSLPEPQFSKAHGFKAPNRKPDDET